jgi:DNA topoisomerase I
MSQKVVIVESPTKARTITRYLRDGAEVLACMGHVRDLPTRTLGVDIADGFKPSYELTPNGKKVMGKLKSAVAGARDVYLATDPDREGEAIAWHLQQALDRATKANFHRVTFHEITESAIQRAFAETDELDLKRVDAQQARRILDRLVGYKISPLLWKDVRKGTSAGRVQSVALRLVCEREREISAFVPQEYWNLIATFLADGTDLPFAAKLAKLDDRKPEIGSAEEAVALADELEKAAFRVRDDRRRSKRQNPSPPFITSTLQQIAGGRLRITTRQTMQLAQQLYEGVELGGEGPTGLITYMRTDSVAVANEAQDSARRFIAEQYGPDYVPAKPNRYKSKQGAQGAHEAIRPTDVNRRPEDVAPFLNAQQLRLYRLIWNRFVASQMAPARLDEHTVEIGTDGGNLAHDYLFRATETKVVFPGHLKVYEQTRESGEDGDAEEAAAANLPDLAKGVSCALQDLDRKQLFTEPPRRFSEATLVRELEEKGVGRPSTYASIVSTIQQRQYVTKDKSLLVPSELGFQVNDYLVGKMPELFQVGFTAEMETQLDRIEEGTIDLHGMLDAFYAKFREWANDLVAVAVPEVAKVNRIFALFPDDFAWEPPVKKGRQTFDDRKFCHSLREQVEGGKQLSDKQWRALLALVGRYAAKLPGLGRVVEELDIAPEMEGVIERGREAAAGRTAEKGQLTDKAQALLDALSGVKFSPPVKRGKRTYDDAAFCQSLRQQAEESGSLSDAQIAALGKIAARYADQIPGFAALAEEHAVDLPQAKPMAAAGDIEPLLDLLEHVREWHPARQVRGRTYDDKQFADSVRRQFTERRELSVRQLEALRKVLSRYHGQIPDYAQVAGQYGLALPAADGAETKGGRAKAVESGEPCPECGAPLVQRRSRRGPFTGCSAYPKCRYIKK